MDGALKYGIYAGAALFGLVIYWVLTEHTSLAAPIPLFIAIIFVVSDIAILRYMLTRQR
jgi:apolipoprotein N-acyltransferase